MPKSRVDRIAESLLPPLYQKTGRLIEESRFKEALEEIFAYIRSANKYFDEQQPWKQINENPAGCETTMATCVAIIANLAQLLEPFLPFSSKEVQQALGMKESSWKVIYPDRIQLSGVKPLFERIDIKQINEELKRLGNPS